MALIGKLKRGSSFNKELTDFYAALPKTDLPDSKVPLLYDFSGAYLELFFKHCDWIVQLGNGTIELFLNGNYYSENVNNSLRSFHCASTLELFRAVGIFEIGGFKVAIPLASSDIREIKQSKLTSCTEYMNKYIFRETWHKGAKNVYVSVPSTTNLVFKLKHLYSISHRFNVRICNIPDVNLTTTSSGIVKLTTLCTPTALEKNITKESDLLELLLETTFNYLCETFTEIFLAGIFGFVL